MDTLKDPVIYTWKPGSKVIISKDKIEGIINAVCIYSHGGILYEIIWWKERDRLSAWMSVEEFSVTSEQSSKTIGFR